MLSEDKLEILSNRKHVLPHRSVPSQHLHCCYQMKMETVFLLVASSRKGSIMTFLDLKEKPFLKQKTLSVISFKPQIFSGLQRDMTRAIGI